MPQHVYMCNNKYGNGVIQLPTRHLLSQIPRRNVDIWENTLRRRFVQEHETIHLESRQCGYVFFEVYYQVTGSPRIVGIVRHLVNTLSRAPNVYRRNYLCAPRLLICYFTRYERGHSFPVQMKMNNFDDLSTVCKRVETLTARPVFMYFCRIINVACTKMDHLQFIFRR